MCRNANLLSDVELYVLLKIPSLQENYFYVKCSSIYGVVLNLPSFIWPSLGQIEIIINVQSITQADMIMVSSTSVHVRVYLLFVHCLYVFIHISFYRFIIVIVVYISFTVSSLPVWQSHREPIKLP